MAQPTRSALPARAAAPARGERDCDYVLVGPGAGGGPTAVAVLGDVCELARGERSFSGAPSLIRAGHAEASAAKSKSTCRFTFALSSKIVPALSAISARTFGRIGVNISEIWQLRHVEDELHGLVQSYLLKRKAQEVLPFVMTLERTTLRQMRKALDSIRNRDYIVVDPVWFPIWG